MRSTNRAPDFLSNSYLTGSPPTGTSMMTLRLSGGLSPAGMRSMFMMGRAYRPDGRPREEDSGCAARVSRRGPPATGPATTPVPAARTPVRRPVPRAVATPPPQSARSVPAPAAPVPAPVRPAPAPAQPAPAPVQAAPPVPAPAAPVPAP